MTLGVIKQELPVFVVDFLEVCKVGVAFEQFAFFGCYPDHAISEAIDKVKNVFVVVYLGGLCDPWHSVVR